MVRSFMVRGERESIQGKRVGTLGGVRQACFYDDEY